MLFPVTSFVCEVLPEGQRESSRTEEVGDACALRDGVLFYPWKAHSLEGSDY